MLEMIDLHLPVRYLNFIVSLILISIFSCTKEPQIISTNELVESPREPLEVNERDSIVGEYLGIIHFYDQNLIVGNEIDTSYVYSYEVVKHGLDSIRIIPPLPLYYSEISNEFFKYDSSNYYDDYYTTSYTGYSLMLKFNPDSSKMEFRTSFSVGIDYDNHFYEYEGLKN